MKTHIALKIIAVLLIVVVAIVMQSRMELLETIVKSQQELLRAHDIALTLLLKTR